MALLASPVAECGHDIVTPFGRADDIDVVGAEFGAGAQITRDQQSLVPFKREAADENVAIGDDHDAGFVAAGVLNPP